MVGQLSLPFLPQELGKAIVLGGWDALKCAYCQRKLGSNTSELRTNRILRLEMMKGGMSSNNT